jgi:hypothetical protein
MPGFIIGMLLGARQVLEAVYGASRSASSAYADVDISDVKMQRVNVGTDDRPMWVNGKVVGNVTYMYEDDDDKCIGIAVHREQ